MIVQVEAQLQCAVKDDLISAYLAVGFKGARVGVEQEGYRIPEVDPDFVSPSDGYTTRLGLHQ